MTTEGVIYACADNVSKKDRWLRIMQIAVKRHVVKPVSQQLSIPRSCIASATMSFIGNDRHMMEVFLSYVKTLLGHVETSIDAYPAPLTDDHQESVALGKGRKGRSSPSLPLGCFDQGDDASGARGGGGDGAGGGLDPSSTAVRAAVLLLHAHLDSDLGAFKAVLQELLELSRHRRNLTAIEFFWPQLVHALFRAPVIASSAKTLWLEEFFLSICKRSVHLALLLVWELQGRLDDCLAVVQVSAIGPGRYI
jgi:hypothetical protein